MTRGLQKTTIAICAALGLYATPVTATAQEISLEPLSSDIITNLLTGGFVVTQKVFVDGKPEASPTPFKVRYTCKAITGEQTGELTVTTETPARVDNIPLGTECELFEQDGDREGYTKTVGFDKQKFFVTDKNQVITATNTYAREQGVFKITSKIVGAETGRKFRVDYSCIDPKVSNGQGPVTSFLEVDGEATSPPLSLGSICTLTVPNQQLPGYALDKIDIEPKPEVVIGREPVDVTLTNNYVRSTGSISIAQKLQVDGKPANPDASIKVGYTCGGLTGEAELKNGNPARIENIPTGTQCEFTDLGGDRAGYIKNSQFDKQKVTVTTKEQAITLTENYNRDAGSLTISKRVTGNAVALAPKTFKFDYQCAAQRGTVEVRAGETVTIPTPTVPGLTCTVTEQDAQVPAAPVATTYFVNGQPAGTQVPTNAKFLSSSDYTARVGKFTVSKKITADIPTGRNDFPFTYTCQPAYDGAFAPVDQVLTITSTSAVSIDLPLGTTCTVTEQDAPVAGYTWNAPASQSVTVGGSVLFENVYKRQTAQFGIANTVRVWEPLRNGTINFTYECVDPAHTKITGTLAVSGNGQQAIAPEKLPVGTLCTVYENAQDAQRTGFRHYAPEAFTFTVGEKDVNKVIGFNQTSTYVPVVPFIVPVVRLLAAPIMRLFDA